MHKSINGKYTKIGTMLWGCPHQIEYDPPYVYNRLFVTEKIFKTKAETMEDIEMFKLKPDVNYTEIMNDVFGDG